MTEAYDDMIYVGTRRPGPTKASWADQAGRVRPVLAGGWRAGPAKHLKCWADEFTPPYAFTIVSFSQSVGARHLRSKCIVYSLWRDVSINVLIMVYLYLRFMSCLVFLLDRYSLFFKCWRIKLIVVCCSRFCEYFSKSCCNNLLTGFVAIMWKRVVYFFCDIISPISSPCCENSSCYIFVNVDKLQIGLYFR